MIVAIDKEHILTIDILNYSRCFVFNDVNINLQYNKQFAKGFLAHTDQDGKSFYLSLGPANRPFLMISEFGKLDGIIELPENTVSFVTSYSDYERQFCQLLEFDLKKNNNTLFDFYKREETDKAGMRLRLFDRKGVVDSAQLITKENVNFIIKAR